MVADLHEVEQKNDMNLDAAANLSGELLGELYVWKKDVYERDLRELGILPRQIHLSVRQL